MTIDIFSSMQQAKEKLIKRQGITVGEAIIILRYLDPVPLPHGVSVPRLLRLMEKEGIIKILDNGSTFRGDFTIEISDTKNC